MLKQLSILAIVVLLNATLWIGCGGETSVNTPVTQETVQPPGTEFSAQEAQAQRYENWIAKMDPYVTTNPDGTYTLDFDGFISSIRTTNPKVASYFTAAGVSSEDAKVIETLKNGIPLANAEILQPSAKGSVDVMLPDAAGSACWQYWWGKRCCYWGSTAQQIANYLLFGGSISIFIPILAGVSGISGALLQLYVTAYGGFCVNMPRGFPIVPPFITRP